MSIVSADRPCLARSALTSATTCEAKSPHYNYWRDRAEHEVWFEDARSIRSKLALASEYQLHGVSIWNIMRYFPQLWLVLNNLYDIEKYA